MKLDRVKKALSHASIGQLDEMRVWIEGRVVELQERELKRRANAKWLELQPLAVGDSLFVHGGPMYEGRIWLYSKGRGFTNPTGNETRIDISRHTLFVRIVQPRLRRLWVETNGEAFGNNSFIRIGFPLSADDLSANDIRKVPSPSQVTEAILQENDGEEIPF